MNNRLNDVIISGNNVELTEGLKTLVLDKVTRLFNHENNIIRIRIELETRPTPERERQQVAKGIIEIRGPDLVVSAVSDDLYKSVDLLVNKLDRKLRRRSRLERVKRKQPHAVEIPATLPKVAVA